jgi:AraC-like DNA-binding protein
MSEQNLARSRQRIARLRQVERSLRTFALDLGPSTFVPPRSAGWAQLLLLRSGSALLQCRGAWVSLDRETAFWIPADEAYVLDLRTRCELRIVYASAPTHLARSLGPLETSALLFELVERAVRCGYLDPNASRDARILSVIDDELANLRTATPAHRLVSPSSLDLLVAVEAYVERTESPNVRALASGAGMSLRTFERRFIRETGLTPRAWLRRARLYAALVALQSGASVTEAGFACGYSSLSAFVAAYRAVFGETPGRFAKVRSARS